MALAVVGAAVPHWVQDLANVTLIGPGPGLEERLNRVLTATRAATLLPVQADDRLDAAALLRLARRLAGAPGCYACAAGVTEQVRRDGTVRRVAAAPLSGSRAVLAALRLPTPVLFRTDALRAAGGWRPGEACWEHRSRRHRALLARLLADGALLATGERLGTNARVDQQTDLGATLQALRLRQVTVAGPGFRASGRLVALTPDLATLAGGSITLVPTARITSVIIP